MKNRALQFVLVITTALLISPSTAYAQQTPPVDCDPQVQEVCPEADPITKGVPSPETVAGTNEELAPQPVVLGASTEVLAETGYQTNTTVAVGLTMIVAVIKLNNIKTVRYTVRGK